MDLMFNHFIFAGLLIPVLLWIHGIIPFLWKDGDPDSRPWDHDPKLLPPEKRAGESQAGGKSGNALFALQGHGKFPFSFPFPSLFPFFQAYMFKCVLSCFKYIKASRREEVKVEPQAVEKVRKSEFTPESGSKTVEKVRKNEFIPGSGATGSGKGA